MAAAAGTRRGLSALLHSSRALPRRLRPLAAASASGSLPHLSPLAPPSRGAKTALPGKSGYSPLNDPSPNWSNRPPKETILLDGCDYEHWLIVMEFPTDPKPSEEDMVAAYIKTLTAVLGSEEEAKKKIYSVCTTTYTGFGALISEELSYKVKGLPGVLWVLPDSYLDVPNKDYGGDLFVDGKVIHRPQFQFTERQQVRTRPRPRYDRRRETMQVERRETMQRGPSVQEHRTPFSQAGHNQDGSTARTTICLRFVYDMESNGRGAALDFVRPTLGCVGRRSASVVHESYNKCRMHSRTLTKSNIIVCRQEGTNFILP